MKKLLAIVLAFIASGNVFAALAPATVTESIEQGTGPTTSEHTLGATSLTLGNATANYDSTFLPYATTAVAIETSGAPNTPAYTAGVSITYYFYISSDIPQSSLVDVLFTGAEGTSLSSLSSGAAYEAVSELAVGHSGVTDFFKYSCISNFIVCPSGSWSGTVDLKLNIGTVYQVFVSSGAVASGANTSVSAFADPYLSISAANPNAASLHIEVSDGVGIAPVPEPSTASLFGLGLALAFGGKNVCSRRRPNSSSSAVSANVASLTFL